MNRLLYPAAPVGASVLILVSGLANAQAVDADAMHAEAMHAEAIREEGPFIGTATAADADAIHSSAAGELVADGAAADPRSPFDSEDPQPAAMQPAPPSSDNRIKAFSEMVENIVITSRKRRESIQEIPLSVTALTPTSIKQLGIRRVEDISAAVPNLEYGRTVGFSSSARANIRGVGQTDPIGTLDPGVGLYVDGVYLARLQGGLLNTSDVERIEVVRGPQGTIFGKNTIGGAVSIVTKRPEFEFGGSAEVRAGNFDLFETRAVLNVPLVEERAAMRLSFATATRDGFEKERLGGTDPNDEKLLGGRAQFLLLPTENFEILLSADLARENQVLSQGKCKVQNAGANANLQFLNSAVGFTAACAAVEASDNPRRVESDVSFLRDDLTTWGASAQLTWSLGANTELRSLSSVRGLDNENFNDFDGTRIELIRPAVDAPDFEQTQISQELQFSTSMLNDRLNLLAGVYGFREKSKDQVIEGVLSNVTADDILPVIPALGPDPLPLAVRGAIADAIRGAQVQSLNRVVNLSYAAFTQVSYDVTDRLNVTAGLRFTQDRRRLFREGLALTAGVGLDTSGASLMPGDTAFFFERSERFSDFSPSASLSYQFSPNLLGYANYSSGFKSGGFNGRAFPPRGVPEDQFPIEFDPEKLTTYELGFKATFAEQRIALNAAAFYTIYEDIQLVVLPGDPSVNNVPVQLLNAGESIIKGGEIELTVSPFPSLQIRSAIGILDDRFTDFDDPSDPRAKDRHLQFLSAYQTSTSIEYSFDLSRLGMVVARADWSTQSQQFLEVTNADALKAGKRGLLDARLSLSLMDGVTELAVFGKNLLDREYLVSGVDFSNTFGNVQRFFGPPRSYGLEIRRRF